MNNQISLLQDLDRASDPHRPNLCRTWPNAMLNDCCVYTDGRRDFEASKGYCVVTIHCAMVYPKVHYSFSVCGKSAGGGWLPGDDDECFDVHDQVANAMLMVEHSLSTKVGTDKEMVGLMREALEKMEKSIKEDTNG